MKRSLAKTVCAVLVVVLLCGLSFSAGASNVQQKIEAYLSPDVTITMDGLEQKFFDYKGDRLYPILYNGSTYLPMAVMCREIMGYDVSWDQATRTASIATKAVNGVDLLEEYNAYDLTGDRWASQNALQFKSSDGKEAEISGITLNHWLQFWVADYVGKGGFGLASFNVFGKYDTVTFKYYATQDATLQVIGDNDSVLAEIQVSGGQVAQETTVQLLKTNQLTFKLTNKASVNLSGYVFDARLK